LKSLFLPVFTLHIFASTGFLPRAVEDEKKMEEEEIDGDQLSSEEQRHVDRTLVRECVL
jgi:hypothetical protein